VGGLEAFIVNVDPDNRRDPIPQPNTMFEIVATVRLRDVLGLSDLSSVTLSFDPLQVADYRP
jgi:CTP-dependent riboflavin kinase